MVSKILVWASPALLLPIPMLFNSCGEPMSTFKPVSVTAMLTDDVSINEPANLSVTQRDVVLKGQCSNGINVSVEGDILKPENIPCVNRQYSFSLQLTAGDGNKTVVVKQKDASNRTTMMSRTFILDSTPPTLSLVTPTEGQAVQANAIVQGTCENGLEVTFKEGTKSYSMNCLNGMLAATVALSSADGPVNLVVSQTDAAGNRVQRSVTLNKDTVAPTVSITSPRSNASVTSLVAVSGACESNINVEISGTGVLAPVTQPCTANAYSASVPLTSSAGAKQIQVRQVDPAGNAGSAVVSVQKQAAAAIAIAVNAPAANTPFRTSLTVSGTCENGLAIALSGNGWASPASTTCTNGTFSVLVNFTTGDGSKNLILTQTNSDGQSGVASRTFIRDTTAPTLTIASPAAQSVFKSSLNLVGSCETGLAVQIDGTGVSAPISANCTNGAFSSSVNFSTPEGNKSIQVSQTDLAGNTTSVSRIFVKDSVAPIVTIASPATNTSDENGLMITGSCEGTFVVTAEGTGAASPVSKACASGNYSLNVVFSAGEGVKEIQVSQTDAAGNTGAVTRSFRRTAVVIDGPALYAQYCASCHGNLNQSAKLGRTASQISAAIQSIPQMQTLSPLTTAQRAAIAAALDVPVDTPPYACNSPNDLVGNLAQSHARRISSRQLQLTLIDLFGRFLGTTTSTTIVNTAWSASSIPRDTAPRYKRWDNSISSTHAQGYFSLADLVSKSVTSSTHYSNFFTAAINLNKGACTTLNTGTPSVDCQKQLIRNLGLRFLRRPLSEVANADEVEDYRREFTSGSTGATAVGNLVFRMLLAPHFLMHLENNESTYQSTPNVLTLSSYSIANRLSYAFWNMPPDETLLNMAQTSNLSQDAAFNTALTHVMGKSANFQDSAKEFFNEWLKLDEVPRFQTTASPAFTLFAGNANYSSTMRTEIINEAEELGAYIATSGGTFKDIFTTEVSFARGELMKVYGVTQAAPTLVTPANAVRLPAGQNPGILTRLAFTATSSTGNKNPVLRGARARRDILCMKTDPPPPTLPADALHPPPYDVNLTARERYTVKTSPASCISCHAGMNPLGFALSNYNGLGRFELTEPAFNADGTYASRQLNIDATADLGQVFGGNAFAQSPAQFTALISERREAKTCFTQEYAKYFLNREPTESEGCRLNKMYTHIIQSKSLNEFMRSLALDPDFRLRKWAP